MTTNTSRAPLSSTLWRGHGDAAAGRRSRIWVPMAATALLLFSIFNVYLNLNQDSLPPEVEGVTTFGVMRSAVASGPVDYDLLPPAGGQHAELAHLCGLYRVPLIDEHAVKSLATGAVWVAYNPDLPEEDIEILREEATGHLDVLLSPYPGLEEAVVLTAWERQLRLDSVEDPRIPFFIHVYQNSERAPAVDETCSIGVGPQTP